MPKITVWKCPHTGQLFEEYDVYKRHLATLSRERVRARNWQRIVDGLEDTISKIQLVNNMQEWCDYLMAHQKEFIIYGALGDWPGNDILNKALLKGHCIQFPKLASINVESKWNESVSNSHSCPRNGYTNWGGTSANGNLREYPGWHGRVIARYAESQAAIWIKQPQSKQSKRISAPSISDITGGFSHSKSLAGLNTGSGGGGGGGAYEASMFLADFPNMEKSKERMLHEINKDLTWKILQNPSLRQTKNFTPLDNVGCGEATI